MPVTNFIKLRKYLLIIYLRDSILGLTLFVKPEKNAESTKHQLLEELKEAVKELSLIEKGEAKSRPINALIDEL